MMLKAATFWMIQRRRRRGEREDPSGYYVPFSARGLIEEGWLAFSRSFRCHLLPLLPPKEGGIQPKRDLSIIGFLMEKMGGSLFLYGSYCAVTHTFA